MNANFRNKVLIGTSALTLTFGLAIATSALGWFTSGNTIDPSVSTASKNAYFAGGKGTSDDPYQIASATHFYNLCWLQYLGKFNQPASKGQTAVKQTYFVLNNDIDLSEISSTDSRTLTLPPIGTTDNPFVGNFDGKSFTIKNAHVISGGSSSSTVDTDYPIHPYAVKNGASGINISGLFGVVGSLSEATSSTTTSAAVTYKDVASGATSTTNMTYNPSINAIKNVKIAGIEVENKLEQNLSGLAIGFMNGTASGISLTDSGTVSSSVVFDSTAPQAYSTGSLSVLTNRTALSDYSLVGTATASYVQSVNRSTSEIYTPDTSSADFTAASGTLTDWGGSIDFTTAYKNLATLKAKAEWTMDRSTSDVHPLKETNVASTGENPKVSNSLNYDYGMVTKDEEMTTDTSGSTTSMKKALRFSQKKGMEYYFPNATISDSSKQYSSFQFCHDAINSVSVNTGGKQKTLNGINFLQASCSSYGFSNSISHETKAAETTSSSHTGLLIYTDSNYLSYETVTGEDDTISLSISNATSDSDAASWWYGENGGDIFTVYGGTKYYLNSDFSGNLSLSTTASTLWKESISNGNAIFTTTSITVGTDTESMELELSYKSGWLAEAPYYTIQCGGYYLAYNTSSGSLVTGTTSLSSLSSTRSAYFVKKTYSLTTAITDPDDSTKKIVDSATYFQTRDATTTYTLNVNGSRTPVLNTNAVATTSTAVNSTLFLYQNGSHSYLFTQGTDNYGDPFVASGNTGNPKAEYYLCYNSGWKTASVNKIAYEYVLTIGEPTLSTSDSSESESYIRTTNTTATEESTIDTIDTYFPLNNNNNDLEDKSHSSESFGVPGERNTGYFTSGSHLNDDPCSDMRFKPFYESGGGSAQNTAYSGNISYASSDTSKSSPTLATCYTVAADRERTSSASPIYTTIGTDGKYSYTDNGTTVTNQFKKYKASKSKFETESLPQKLDLAFTSTANKADHSICGFHFKSNSSSPDFGKDTVTIPNAYVNDDSSNPWKTNYEIPNPCVDFYLKGSGYVNFFSETDYGGNNSFFGVNLIHRVNNQYLGVYKIKTVWAEADDLKKDGDSYIYELCDSSWNTIGYTQPYNSHLNLTTKALERHPISFDSDGKRTISTSSLDDTYRFTVLDSKPASGVYTKRVFDTKWLIDLSAINGTYKNKFF